MTIDTSPLDRIPGLSSEQCAQLQRRGFLSIPSFVKLATTQSEKVSEFLEVTVEQLAALAQAASALLPIDQSSEPQPVVPPFGLIPPNEREICEDEAGFGEDDILHGKEAP